VLGLTDAEVDRGLHEVEAEVAGRHPDAAEVFEQHAELVTRRLDASSRLTPTRRRFLGSVFTHEYAIEAAALCNPSIVRHPVPRERETAFVMSVRGIGEGHRSSIGFRTGTVAADGAVTVDPAGAHPHTGAVGPAVHHREVVRRGLAAAGRDHDDIAYVLDSLPERFDDVQLTARVAALADDAGTRRHTTATFAHLQRLAESSYLVEFPLEGALSDRVLWPASAAERQGMEDARFVEVTDGSAPRYCATYTAFDGAEISQHLLTTHDFVTFGVSPMAGDVAQGKGLALFPRTIRGRHVALTRSDRETNAVATSSDLRCWDEASTIQTPEREWDVVQVGNCGSPIETSEGWLVLTHGVGALRTYSIGALLLDLDRPEVVIAVSDRPILTPDHAGYVPNVVYTCGALLVGRHLVVPHGRGDRSIAFATFDVDALIASMRRV